MNLLQTLAKCRDIRFLSSDTTHHDLDLVGVLAQWLQSALPLPLTPTLKKLVFGGSITDTQDHGTTTSQSSPARSYSFLSLRRSGPAVGPTQCPTQAGHSPPASVHISSWRSA
jgi:hypothetical protein